MAVMIFTKPKYKEIAEEILGFKIVGKYLTMQTPEELQWLSDRIDEVFWREYFDYKKQG